MAFGLYSLLEAALLVLNAMCVLHEERFLAKVSKFVVTKAGEMESHSCLQRQCAADGMQSSNLLLSPLSLEAEGREISENKLTTGISFLPFINVRLTFFNNSRLAGQRAPTKDSARPRGSRNRFWTLSGQCEL